MCDQLFRSHSRLLQDRAQSADCKFRVQGDDTTRHFFWRNALKDDVTPALPHLNKAQPFKSANRNCP